MKLPDCRKFIVAALLLLCLPVAKTRAQEEKSKVPVFNYVIDDPMDAFGRQNDSSTIIQYFLFPQFYSYWPVIDNDTVLKYVCYDQNQNLVGMDTLHNILSVQHISFIKTYNDYLHTYIDTADGKPKPMVIVKPVYEYNRTGADTWKGFDYFSNYTSQLREYKNEILRSDTTSVADPSGGKHWSIRQYYRVMEMEDSMEVKSDTTVADPLDSSKKQLISFYYYTVPSFYFHQPRKVQDTTYEFLSYDYRDSLIKDVRDFDSVKYYSLYKSYTDSAHTYNDANGQKQFLPVATIIQRFDRQGRDKWMSIEYPSNRFTELKEFKSLIISSDTETIKAPNIDSTALKIYKHYQVIKQ